MNLPEEQNAMKLRQPLEQASKDIKFMSEQALTVPDHPVPASEAKRVSQQQLFRVYMRIPKDAELTGVLEKYKGFGLTIFALLHCIAVEYALNGLPVKNVNLLNLITTRLLGKVPLPIKHEGSRPEEEDSLTVEEIRKLLEG